MQQKDKYAPTSRHKIALWLFSLFPNILGVALCNSRAMGEEDKNSDIDLFVIAKSGRLWTVRFIVTTIASILGIRRKSTHGLAKSSPEYIKRTRDKFCLSFFITEDAMSLDPIRIENDIYLDKWIKTLVSLVDRKNTLERFWAANGLKKFDEKAKKQSFLYFVFCILYFVFLIPENVIKHLWLPHTLHTYKNLGKPWGVIISDTMLKFHDNDQRRNYRDTHM